MRYDFAYANATERGCDMDKNKEIQQKLSDLKELARSHGAEADDPKCQALCETTAEVLGGLVKAYEDYQNKAEAAWK